MHDRNDVVLLEDLAEQSAIRRVTDDERQPEIALYDHSVTLAQVVEHDGRVPSLAQGEGSMASDVPGAAGDEYGWLRARHEQGMPWLTGP